MNLDGKTENNTLQMFPGRYPIQVRDTKISTSIAFFMSKSLYIGGEEYVFRKESLKATPLWVCNISSLLNCTMTSDCVTTSPS